MTDALTEAGLAHLDQVVDAHVGDTEVPGAVVLVTSGNQTHVRAAGSLSVGGPPVARDSLFRIASISKPITGAAAMALVAEGVFALDDPVGSWLPELAEPRVLRRPDGPLDDTEPADRPITVRDLLTFTFGFGVNEALFAAPEPWPITLAEAERRLSTLGPPDPGNQLDADEWMAGLGSLPLIAQPGERWLYNTGATALGVLMARAIRTPLVEVLRSRIFEPLGMRDTAFFATDTERLATMYQPGAGGLSVSDPPEGMWSHQPRLEDGAAGLVSTVDDLAAFGRAMVSGGSPILSPAAVAAMTTDHLSPEQRSRDTAVIVPADSSWGYCVSVVVEGPRAGAFGWNGGLGTSWLADPARDLNVIVLTQLAFTSPTPPAIHAAVQDAAYDARG